MERPEEEKKDLIKPRQKSPKSPCTLSSPHLPALAKPNASLLLQITLFYDWYFSAFYMLTTSLFLFYKRKVAPHSLFFSLRPALSQRHLGAGICVVAAVCFLAVREAGNWVLRK